VKTLTIFFAYLVGYYWIPCEVCGRGIAILNNGRVVEIWCSKRQHAAAANKETHEQTR